MCLIRFAEALLRLCRADPVATGSNCAAVVSLLSWSFQVHTHGMVACTIQSRSVHELCEALPALTGQQLEPGCQILCANCFPGQAAKEPPARLTGVVGSKRIAGHCHHCRVCLSAHQMLSKANRSSSGLISTTNRKWASSDMTSANKHILGALMSKLYAATKMFCSQCCCCFGCPNFCGNKLTRKFRDEQNIPLKVCVRLPQAYSNSCLSCKCGRNLLCKVAPGG